MKIQNINHSYNVKAAATRPAVNFQKIQADTVSFKGVHSKRVEAAINMYSEDASIKEVIEHERRKVHIYLTQKVAINNLFDEFPRESMNTPLAELSEFVNESKDESQRLEKETKKLEQELRAKKAAVKALSKKQYEGKSLADIKDEMAKASEKLDPFSKMPKVFNPYKRLADKMQHPAVLLKFYDPKLNVAEAGAIVQEEETKTKETIAQNKMQIKTLQKETDELSKERLAVDTLKSVAFCHIPVRYLTRHLDNEASALVNKYTDKNKSLKENGLSANALNNGSGLSYMENAKLLNAAFECIDTMTARDVKIHASDIDDKIDASTKLTETLFSQVLNARHQYLKSHPGEKLPFNLAGAKKALEFLEDKV